MRDGDVVGADDVVGTKDGDADEADDENIAAGCREVVDVWGG